MNIEQLKNNYLEFFNEFKINPKSGVSEIFPGKKFATYPYIGSKYGDAKFKILFVGLDIGKDETPGIQTFEERNSAIERDCCFNPHIAGTYSAALFLLKDIYNWEEVWNNHKSFPTYSQATKKIFHTNQENPLSFVALTNLHKFVTIGRESRAGNIDRKSLKRDEEEILIKEVEILKPDLIFFQMKSGPGHSILEKLRPLRIKMKKAPHPSYHPKGEKNARKPEIYTQRIFDL